MADELLEIVDAVAGGAGVAGAPIRGVRAWIRRDEGRNLLRELQRQIDARCWLLELHEAGEYAPKTLNNALGVLVAALNGAVVDQLVPVNPAAGVERRHGSASRATSCAGCASSRRRSNRWKQRSPSSSPTSRRSCSQNPASGR